MKRHRITPVMLKTAWKMVDTIFDRHRIASGDRDRLLELTTRVALHDLLDNGLVWKGAPPVGRLEFRGRKVVLAEGGGRGSLKKSFDDEEIDECAGQAEELFDRYSLDEDERDTLFTALPCLGLEAAGKRVEWRKEPPFPEVTGG